MTTGSTSRTFRHTFTDPIRAQFTTLTTYRPCFGTKRSQVQILSPRQVKRLVRYIFYVVSVHQNLRCAAQLSNCQGLRHLIASRRHHRGRAPRRQHGDSSGGELAEQPTARPRLLQAGTRHRHELRRDRTADAIHFGARPRPARSGSCVKPQANERIAGRVSCHRVPPNVERTTWLLL